MLTQKAHMLKARVQLKVGEEITYDRGLVRSKRSLRSEMSHFLFSAHCSFGKWQPCLFWGMLHSPLSHPSCHKLATVFDLFNVLFATETAKSGSNANRHAVRQRVQVSGLTSRLRNHQTCGGVFSNNSFSTSCLERLLGNK